MIKKKIKKKDNIINFPTKLSSLEKEIEGIIFAGSLELAKEGELEIKQKDLYEDIYIRENK